MISNAGSMRSGLTGLQKNLQAAKVQGSELTAVTMVPRRNRHVSSGNGAR